MASLLSVFSMGRETYQVPVNEVFVANRKKLIDKMRAANVQGGIIYLKGGPSETRFDSDHEPIFRQESYFWYLSGVKEPDCSMSLDIRTGETTLYIPKYPPSYATIMGRIRSPQDWQSLYCVDHVKFAEYVEEALFQACSQLPVNDNAHGTETPKIFLMNGLNSDSGKMYELPVDIKESEKLKGLLDTETLFPILAECRVVKSSAERSLIQHVTEVTSFAHAYVMRNMKPGMMEYQAESLFRHYSYYNYGCRLVGYTPICGCGPNSAVLHYGHAGEPNTRQSLDGEICLFDMGAEYFGYGSDVTCSFPVDGKFSIRQRQIYEAVLQAQIEVFRMIKPGVSWASCHRAAEKTIIQALTNIGLIILHDKCLDELVEMRLGAVFMPHGLGHLIGIDTHDVGGYLPGKLERIQLPGLKSLRTARYLEEGMTLTVEPGCYFIDHLLDEALANGSPVQGHINTNKIDEYRGFGGIRLEDVICVSDRGCVNYTLCPRTIAEVEHVCAGKPWPPTIDEAPELLRARLTDTTPLL
ncbi:Xaa-Pro dipeptidase [Fistulifera solaris]|uniref:Xaa-Pro dipeptidase n=1 Tax=Fistulifera solaris TaxID=1519565 RepID=A0A1Z5KBY7_FISSO|nr:Xaa-Pro dipeptidase [Fistulifera solaris]|eukprot:GAX23783.1 Xaa-Pro dipeptidase [Fistulifera solaris]